VLGADVVVIKPPGFFLSQDHDPPGPVGKPLEHRLPPRATEQSLAARPERRPDGTYPGKPVIIHPHYASAEVGRDRETTRSPGSSLAVEQVTIGPLSFSTGHSAEMFIRVYAKCMTGRNEHLGSPRRQQDSNLPFRRVGAP
jgi:hypothetical protein